MLSVLGAAAGFAVEFALGGTAPVDPTTVATAMLGVHTVLGAIEGVVTALVVLAVVGVRPDLVAGLRRSGSGTVPALPERVEA